MLHHYLTVYVEKGTMYAEAWIQWNLFGKRLRFWRKKRRIM